MAAVSNSVEKRLEKDGGLGESLGTGSHSRGFMFRIGVKAYFRSRSNKNILTSKQESRDSKLSQYGEAIGRLPCFIVHVVQFRHFVVLEVNISAGFKSESDLSK